MDVIARAKPAQKLMLVKSLQAGGEIVAVTGDGVNDVPALQAADVGVAMGERGTRSAREVAAIVLLDDNFRTIVGAIREGRQLFQNLRSSFQYLLMIHIPFVVTATLIPLAGYPLLYLPVHIVLLEIMIHPTAMLAFQEPADRVLARRTHIAGRAQFFGFGEWVVIVLTGIVISAMVMAGYLRSLEGVQKCRARPGDGPGDLHGHGGLRGGRAQPTPHPGLLGDIDRHDPLFVPPDPDAGDESSAPPAGTPLGRLGARRARGIVRRLPAVLRDFLGSRIKPTTA